MATDQRTAAPTPSNDLSGVPFHTLDLSATSACLEVEPEFGLSSGEAAKRLSRHGRNVIEEKRRRSVLAMLLGQFADFMILVLIGAAVISGVVGDVKDTVVIVAIVVVNAAVGFIQEFRAER